MCACVYEIRVCVNRGQLPTNQLHDINVCVGEAHVLNDCELKPLDVCVCMYGTAYETHVCV